MNSHFLVAVSWIILFLLWRSTSGNSATVALSFWRCKIVISTMSRFHCGLLNGRSLIQVMQRWLRRSQCWARHQACCRCSWTGQSLRRTPLLYYLSIGLSCHPSPAKSPWFLLPISWLQHQHSQPRHGLVESASGLYKDLGCMIFATKWHHITFLVPNGGQWFSGGYHMFISLNTHRECWKYCPGWCNTVAEESRVCWRFWRV